MEINQTLNDVDQSSGFLNNSRGTDASPSMAQKYVADESAGRALSGMADLFSLATKAGDEYIKRNIDEQATSQTDQVFAEFGVGDYATVDATVSKEPVPGQIEESMKNIDRLTKASSKGTISETSYWARMESISRQLRARYPGHRDYIDQRISSIAGGKPANQLVQELFRAGAQAAGAQDYETKQKNNLIEEFTKAGVLSSSDVDKAQGMTRTQLLEWKADVFADKRNNDLQMQRLSLMDKKDELTIREYEKQALKQNSDMFASVVRDTTSGLGKTWADLQPMMNKARSGNATAEETQQLAALTNQFEQAYTVTVMENMIPFQGVLPPDKYKAAVESALAPVKAMKQFLVDGDTSALKIIATNNEARKSAAVKNLYDTSETALKVEAFKNVYGPEALNLQTSMDAEVGGAVNQAARNSLNLKIGTEKDSSILNEKKAGNIPNPTVERSVVKTQVAMILSPNVSQASKDKAVDILFGPNNQGYLDSIDAKDRSAVFSMIVNGETYNRIKGDPQAVKKFVEWSQTAFLSANKTEADTLKKAAEQGIKVNYLPEARRYTVDPVAPSGGPTGKGGLNNPKAIGQTVVYQNAVAAANKLNTSILAISPAMNDVKIPVETLLGQGLGLPVGTPGNSTPMRASDQEQVNPRMAFTNPNFYSLANQDRQIDPVIGDSMQISETLSAILETQSRIKTLDGPELAMEQRKLDALRKEFNSLIDNLSGLVNPDPGS